MANWSTEKLRLTTFFASEASPSNTTTWWKDVVHDDPDEEFSRPKVGEIQQAGSFGEQKLSLVGLPGRVDWNLTSQTKEDQADDLPTMGGIYDTMTALDKIATDWFSVCPPVIRMAIGIVLICPVVSRQDGYTHLAGYLHNVKLDPDGISDFMFQINRPRSSHIGIPSLKINRLSRWSVVLSGRLTLAAGPPNLPTMVTPSIRRVASRLELDVNTAAEFDGTLPKPKLGAVFGELKDMCLEIAEKGDVP